MAEDDRPLDAPGNRWLTIDGPAGVGKSSVARRVADRLRWFHLDTGARYRAVTLLCLRRGLTAERLDEAAVAPLIDALDMKVESGGRVWLDGTEVTAELRSPEVTGLVSPVSALPNVRHKLVDLQRAVGAKQAERGAGVVPTPPFGGGVVIEGRDAGSYVFPQARWRFYLDASLAERARRRLRQELGDQAPAPEPLTAAMERLATRDRIDRERDFAPLKVPDGATVLDTTHMSLEQVVTAITQVVRS
jgi:cytidylate kinase